MDFTNGSHVPTDDLSSHGNQPRREDLSEQDSLANFENSSILHRSPGGQCVTSQPLLSASTGLSSRVSPEVDTPLLLGHDKQCSLHDHHASEEAVQSQETRTVDLASTGAVRAFGTKATGSADCSVEEVQGSPEQHRGTTDPPRHVSDCKHQLATPPLPSRGEPSSDLSQVNTAASSQVGQQVGVSDLGDGPLIDCSDRGLIQADLEGFALMADQQGMEQLLGFGFHPNQAAAVLLLSNNNAMVACDMLFDLSKSEDRNQGTTSTQNEHGHHQAACDEAVRGDTHPTSRSENLPDFFVRRDHVHLLEDMQFSRYKAIAALVATNNNIQMAADLLYTSQVTEALNPFAQAAATKPADNDLQHSEANPPSTGNLNDLQCTAAGESSSSARDDDGLAASEMHCAATRDNGTSQAAEARYHGDVICRGDVNQPSDRGDQQHTDPDHEECLRARRRSVLQRLEKKLLKPDVLEKIVAGISSQAECVRLAASLKLGMDEYRRVVHSTEPVEHLSRTVLLKWVEVKGAFQCTGRALYSALEDISRMDLAQRLEGIFISCEEPDDPKNELDHEALQELLESLGVTEYKYFNTLQANNLDLNATLVSLLKDGGSTSSSSSTAQPLLQNDQAGSYDSSEGCSPAELVSLLHAGSGHVILEVSPTSERKTFPIVAGRALFGPTGEKGRVEGELVRVSPEKASSPILTDVRGKIAFVERGQCDFMTKVRHAQEAFASGVVVCDTSPSQTTLYEMGYGDHASDDDITIPAALVIWKHGECLYNRLHNNERVLVRFIPDPRAPSVATTPVVKAVGTKKELTAAKEELSKKEMFASFLKELIPSTTPVVKAVGTKKELTAAKGELSKKEMFASFLKEKLIPSEENQQLILDVFEDVLEEAEKYVGRVEERVRKRFVDGTTNTKALESSATPAESSATPVESIATPVEPSTTTAPIESSATPAESSTVLEEKDAISTQESSNAVVDESLSISDEDLENMGELKECFSEKSDSDIWDAYIKCNRDKQAAADFLSS